MDADFLAGVVAAALQDELRTGTGRDDRGLLLRLVLRAGAGLLGDVFCRSHRTKVACFYGPVQIFAFHMLKYKDIIDRL